jgi:multicomponent Na+:H+ antiporter subunit D
VIRQHLPILPVLLPLAGALLVPIVAIWRQRLAAPVACLSAAAAAAVSIAGLIEVGGGGVRRYAVGGWAPPLGIEVVLDPLSAFVTASLTTVAAVTLLASGPAARRVFGAGTTAFHALTLLVLTAVTGIVVSGDVFNVFVFLEVGAIASYALIAGGGARSLLAGFRYLVIGTAGASFYLLGIGFLYAVTGTLNMADLAVHIPEIEGSPVLTGGIVFVAVGLAIKMGLFPVHHWLPDAYTHAPAPVAAFIAPIATKAAAYAMARLVLYVVHPEGVPITAMLAAAGGAAVLFGGVQAVRQRDGRRLLAYSSISQMGYIAIGFGLANTTALAGAYLHVLAHALMKATLFLAVGAAASAGRGVGLGAIGRDMPVTAACAVVAALSMVGLPPTAGFFSKWYLLRGALEADQPLLAAIILAGGLLGAVYTYRLTESVWTGGNGHGVAIPEPGLARATREAPGVVLTGLVLLAIGSIAVGLGSAPLVAHVLVPAAAR